MKEGHRICPGYACNHENGLGSCFSPLIIGLVGDHHLHVHHHHHQYHQHQPYDQGYHLPPFFIIAITITKVTITWAFFAIGEILLLVNLLRVFLVIKVCFNVVRIPVFFNQSKHRSLVKLKFWFPNEVHQTLRIKSSIIRPIKCTCHFHRSEKSPKQKLKKLPFSRSHSTTWTMKGFQKCWWLALSSSTQVYTCHEVTILLAFCNLINYLYLHIFFTFLRYHWQVEKLVYIQFLLIVILVVVPWLLFLRNCSRFS